MKTIGEKIKRLRKSKGLSLMELAKIIGISDTAVLKIETGKTKSITIDIGVGLAKALDISFNEMFEIETAPQNQDQIEKLLSEIERLEKNLQIQTSLLSAFEMLRDGESSNRKELIYNRGLITLIEYFQLIDIQLFAKHNERFINQNSLIQTFDLECVRKFYSFYGKKSVDEILKYFDIEKYKNSSLLDFQTTFWEGTEGISRDQIIVQIEKERKKLI